MGITYMGSTALKGWILLPPDTDWDLIATAIRVMNSSDDCLLDAGHAQVEPDGYFNMPFKMMLVSPRYHQDLGDDTVLSQVRYRLESLFECVAQVDYLDATVKRPDGLNAIEKLSKRIHVPGGINVSAEDIRPESLCTAESAAPASAPAVTRETMDDLIGLDDVKRRIAEIVQFAAKRGRKNAPCLHMCFRGNPGTGKTTVARIAGQMLGEAGVLKNPNVFVETDRSGLVGRVVGSTMQKTSEIIEQSKGGVLFIDEAYALGMYATDLGMHIPGYGGHWDYGDEALAKLVKEMEDHRDDFVCIMAGYTKPMDYMIAQNPGLCDRIGFFVDFPDYSADELARIFCTFAREGGYTLDARAEDALLRAMESAVAHKDEDFGNARVVRKLYERASMRQATLRDDDLISAEVLASALGDDDLAKAFGMGGGEAPTFGFCGPTSKMPLVS